jgi:hypothetical protein
MDGGGPFRGSSSADRRSVNRPEPARQYAEETPRSEPAPVQHASSTHRTTKADRRRKLPLPALIIGIVLLLAVVGWLVWSGLRNAGTAIDGSKYQAVFFTNGQVYFGKLQAFNDEYMKLSDVYYLQTDQEGDSENPQTTSNNQNDVQLIKLGDEIHGPEDEMVISKEQILFYENLKADGRVSQSIEQFKSAN